MANAENKNNLFELLSAKKIRYQYSHLLIALVLIVLLAPVIPDISRDFPFFSLLFAGMAVLALRAIARKRWQFIVGIVLLSGLFLLEFLPGAGLMERGAELSQVLSLAVYILLIAASIGTLCYKVFSEKTVDMDTIQGGISIYLLIGLLWALFYRLIETFDPGAFSIPPYDGSWAHVFFYFSFVTLTTMGYGDILPKNNFAMTLCSTEALVGQIFLTVFISRLVSLHLASQLQKK